MRLQIVWCVPAAMAGTGGTGSAVCACARACARTFADSCESDAWRCLNMLNRFVFGVGSWIGGDGAGGSTDGLGDSPARSGVLPSCNAAPRSGWRNSADALGREACSLRRRKKLVGSRVLRRFRSLSLRLGRTPNKGIAGHEGRPAHSAG